MNIQEYEKIIKDLVSQGKFNELVSVLNQIEEQVVSLDEEINKTESHLKELKTLSKDLEKIRVKTKSLLSKVITAINSFDNDEIVIEEPTVIVKETVKEATAVIPEPEPAPINKPEKINISLQEIAKEIGIDPIQEETEKSVPMSQEKNKSEKSTHKSEKSVIEVIEVEEDYGLDEISDYLEDITDSKPAKSIKSDDIDIDSYLSDF